MFNSVQCQDDITGWLLSAPALNSVNIKNYRKMVTKKEIDMAVLWNTARNGCSGAGILVEEPEADSQNKGISGPVLTWMFPILVLEQPNNNFTQNVGTFLNASMITQSIMDALHQYGDGLYGVFYVEGKAMQPDTSFWERGVVAYRTKFTLSVGKNIQTPRTGAVTVALATGNVTLTCASDPTAQIYFTTDGTGADITKTAYSGPIPVQSGDVIRASAIVSGKNLSVSQFYQVP